MSSGTEKMKKLLGSVFTALGGVNVYALVGKSGTGKASEPAFWRRNTTSPI